MLPFFIQNSFSSKKNPTKPIVWLIYCHLIHAFLKLTLFIKKIPATRKLWQTLSGDLSHLTLHCLVFAMGVLYQSCTLWSVASTSLSHQSFFNTCTQARTYMYISYFGEMGKQMRRECSLHDHIDHSQCFDWLILLSHDLHMELSGRCYPFR